MREYPSAPGRDRPGIAMKPRLQAPRRSSFPRCAVPRALSILALLLVTACGPGAADEDEAIDRETFIDIHVDLHLAAEDREPEEVSTAERNRILADHGVTEEEIRAFIEVHGTDETFMHEVWAEVDRRVVEARGGGVADPGEPGD